MSEWDNKCLKDTIGAKILSVTGLEKGSEEVVFTTDRGTLTMLHDHDCCETVEVEDWTGDVADIIGQAVIVFEERTSETEPPRADPDFGADWIPESYTWTFYEIRTTGGDMQIRWWGESNGYYSEEACLNWVPKT